MKINSLYSVCIGLILFLTSSLSAKNIKYIWKPCRPSKQNILQDVRFNKKNNQSLFKSDNVTFPSVENRKLLAILVEFQKDQDEKTTGDGKFDLSRSSDLAIDSPPHDFKYFNSQLTALSNYYNAVSGGKLILSGEVFEDIFTLPNEMGYYNPGTTDEITDQGMAKLFFDAVKLADSAGIEFSKYDYFIIFHAGVGRDIDLGYDYTIRDIPSAFLNIDDLRTNLEESVLAEEGIPVENNTFYISEGMIFPETENQEGYEIGLLGTMTIMFGFQLGLPALWNTDTGQSGIGRWGLMDQGSGNFNGLIPAEPCAWTKVFLGWEKPVEVQTGTDFVVACSKATNSNKIIKIPINDHEYFLLENRMYDPIRNQINGLDRDSVTVGLDEDGKQVTFLPNGQLEITDSIGVIISVEEYDYGLPGSGVLIWHIDENVIFEKFPQNSINNDKNHKGVDLEEADGAQDIGETYGFLSPGGGSEGGVLHDAWFADNTINKRVNKTDTVAFTPYTLPNSRSVTSGNSHIVIKNFSEIDTLMTFSVRNDLLDNRFPCYFSENENPYPPLFGDIDGDKEIEIIVSTKKGKIYAWEKDGSRVINNNTSEYRVKQNGDTLVYPSALIVDLKEEIVISPVVGDIDKDMQDEIIAVTFSGKLIVWTGLDDDSDDYADIVLESSLNREKASFLIVGNSNSQINKNHIVVGTESGKILFINHKEISVSTAAISGICVSSQVSDNKDQFLVTTEEGEIILLNSDGQIVWEQTCNQDKILGIPASACFSPQQIPYSVTLIDGMGFLINIINGELITLSENRLPAVPSAPALGDIDKDGLIDIVFTAHGTIWGIHYNGSMIDYFPFPVRDNEVVLSAPILGDVDNDGNLDIITTNSDGDIEAYHYDGTMVDGFPISIGGSRPISPALLDLDNNTDLELLTVTEKGMLTVWHLKGIYSPDNVPWGNFLHDPSHSGMNPQQLITPEPQKEWMPSNLVYNYPNPTEGNMTTIRYRLEQPATIIIKIFDLAGQLIDEFAGPGNSQIENEIVWDLTSVESGVYFCQVQAKGNKKEKSVTFKIAVVK
jgi:M6 family metalloprotease-like protein